MSLPRWAADPRLPQAQTHAQRGEVLQAEVLLRGVLQDHPDCLPALSGLAAFTAGRSDWDQARRFLGTALRHEPQDPGLRFRLAQAQAAQGLLDEAKTTLETLLGTAADWGAAWLMLADVREALGDNLGALRARYRAITRAHEAGRWLSQGSTEPELVETVLRHIDILRRSRREHLHQAYQAVRDTHGAAAVARVDHALAGYLGDYDNTPADSRCRPKFFYFPGLPDGPYHDPYLQPWASRLQAAWQDLRSEALDLLAQDRDFVSFLGLQPGQKAPQYVGGSNPNAAWDAFFFYRRGERFVANHAACPKTSAVLDSIDLCHVGRQAPEVCFSLVRPQSSIVAHFGVTNTRLVMHLPLIVPSACALNIVDAGEHHWKPGKLMMFDDTYQHEAWNRSDEPRLILLMDCWNPHLTPPEQHAVKLLVEAIDSIEN